MQAVEREGPGILAMLVRESRAYYADGLLPEPDVVTETTDDYRRSADHFALWINDEVIVTRRDEDRVAAHVLYTRYSAWCDDNGLHAKVLDGSKFKQRMEAEPGVWWKKTKTGAMYFGLTVAGVPNATDEDDDAD